MTVFLTTNKLLNMNSLYAISLVNYNSSLLLKNSPLNSINKIFFLINSKDASYNSALTFNSIASNKFFIDFELIKIKNAVWIKHLASIVPFSSGFICISKSLSSLDSFTRFLIITPNSKSFYKILSLFSVSILNVFFFYRVRLKLHGVGYRFFLEIFSEDFSLTHVVDKDNFLDFNKKNLSLAKNITFKFAKSRPFNYSFDSTYHRLFKVLRIRFSKKVKNCFIISSKNLILLTGALSSIRRLNSPDVYKGKGIRFNKEKVFIKFRKKFGL